MSSSKQVSEQSGAEPDRWQQALREMLSGGFTRTLIAVLLGFLVGTIFMVAANRDFLDSLDSFFQRPGDTVGAALNVIGQGYGALFRGAIFNASASDPVVAFRPITETMRLAAPLIMAGLGIGLGFRVGLFNIGGTGQLVFGLIWATFVATRMELPFLLHTVVATIAAILGASLYGALVGFLKARTGAHEVILTIMLNYVAINLFTWLLRTPDLLGEDRATGNPKAAPTADTALLPRLLGDSYALHYGFVLAIGAVVLFWWLMERSTIGFRLRMVGFNPDAARASGIKVENTYVLAMALSAGFVGLAAANQGLGTATGVTPTSHAGIGFDAITVALLGGSSAPGILLAGLLFGAFKAGSPSMQVLGISPEVLSIVQGSIVLFIAAPPLIRALFRLPPPQNTNVLGAMRDRFFGRGGAR